MTDYTAVTPGILTTGSAYSNAERINVIMASAGDVAGNNHFPPARGVVVDAIGAAVTKVHRQLRPELSTKYPEFVVVVHEGSEPGAYTYTVWSHRP